MKSSNKKWWIVSLVLIFITVVGCIFINKFSQKSTDIDGVEKNVVTPSSSVKVTMKVLSDATLKSLYAFKDSSGNVTLKGIKLFKSNGTVEKVVNKGDHNFYFKTSSGEWVYCIELGKPAAYDNSFNRPTSSTSTYWSNGLSATAKKGIELATVYGYPNVNRKNGNTNYDAYYQYMVTQTIIWEFQQGWRTNYELTPSDTRMYSLTIAKNSKLKAIYNAIITDMKNHSKLPSFNGTTNVLKYNTTTKKYELTLTDANNILANSTVTCPNGVTCTVNGNKLTLTANNPVNAGKVTINKKIPSNTNQGLIILDNNTFQRMILGKANVGNVVGNVTLSTETLGKIIIKKTSEDGVKKGFKFQVTGTNYNQTFTTDDSGVITITNLKLGNYIIKEKDTPNKYIVPSSVSVSLTSSTTTVEKTINNELKNTSSVKVLKVDKETGEQIKGAVLALKNGNTLLSKTIEQWTTDGTAHVVSKTLDIGKKYYVCEITAPVRYEKNSKCVEFTINSKNEAKTVTFENTKVVSEIKKVDENGKAISGVKLRISNVTGDSSFEPIEWTTDGNSKKISGLVMGAKYKIEELYVPDGYVRKTTYFIPTTLIKNKVIKNEKNILKISKTTADKKTKLGGAVLKLLDSDGKVVDEWSTENGKTHEIVGIAAGTYKLVEEKAPLGYQKNKKEIEITISDGKKEFNIVMPNDPTKVIFKKTDFASGKEIAGAKLQVIDSEGKIIDEWTSEEGKTHIIEGKLIEGNTYTLKEITAPKGYAISEEVVFTVGDTSVVEMKNKTTEVTIYKKDTVSEKNVSGAVLQLVDANGNKLDEWTTTDEGHVITALETGVEYTIKEIKAPAKYLEASEVKFTISANEATKEVTVYDTPIVDVPNTAANASVIVIVIGSILVAGGVGTIIWMRKRSA